MMTIREWVEFMIPIVLVDSICTLNDSHERVLCLHIQLLRVLKTFSVNACINFYLFIYFYFKRWYIPSSVYSLLVFHVSNLSQSHALFVHSIRLSGKTYVDQNAYYGISIPISLFLTQWFAQYRNNQIKTIDLLAQFHFNSFHACCSVSHSVVFFLLSFCFVSFRFISMKNHINATVCEEKKATAISRSQWNQRRRRRSREIMVEPQLSFVAQKWLWSLANR